MFVFKYNASIIANNSCQLHVARRKLQQALLSNAHSRWQIAMSPVIGTLR